MGTDIREIQAILGHRNIATTQIYLGHLEAKQVPHADEFAAVFWGAEAEAQTGVAGELVPPSTTGSPE